MTNAIWVTAARTESVVADEPVACHIEGVDIAIFNVEGCYFATSNICTHAKALLTDGLTVGRVVECPLHNGQFDVCTGKALTSPVEIDLQTYEVRIAGDHLEVFLSVKSDDGKE